MVTQVIRGDLWVLQLNFTVIRLHLQPKDLTESLRCFLHIKILATLTVRGELHFILLHPTIKKSANVAESGATTTRMKREKRCVYKRLR